MRASLCEHPPCHLPPTMEPPTLTADWTLLAVVAAGLLLLMAAAVVAALLSRRPAPAAPPEPELSVDVSALPAGGPAADAARLEYYGVPVRLAVLALAPVGRGGAMPAKERLPDLLEQLIPGLLQVVSSHEPLLRFWPTQLSSQGFSNAFFHQVTLPGERGKGTPWCGVAGKFTAREGQFLAGLVFCGDQPNGLGQLVIEHDGQWNDVLRVRS